MCDVNKVETVCIQVECLGGGIKQTISLPRAKLARSNFYCGLFELSSTSCTHTMSNQQDSIYPFPEQYIVALPVYINYCHHELGIKVNVRKLRVCFELAYYLDDQMFVNVLVQCAVKSWPTSIKVIQSLNDIYQRDIYLHLPLMFAPEVYRHDSSFVMSWMTKNRNVNMFGPYNCLYYSQVRYCCFNEDHCYDIDHGLTGITTTIKVGENKIVYGFGMTQEWYIHNKDTIVNHKSTQKQQLMSETIFCYDKRVDIQKMWYPCGTMSKIITYNKKRKVVSCQEFNQQVVNI